LRSDLSGHDLIGYHQSLAQMPPARWRKSAAGPASVVHRSREMTDMVAAASSGLGLAVLPCVLADVEPGLVRLTPEVHASRTLWRWFIAARCAVGRGLRCHRFRVRHHQHQRGPDRGTSAPEI
jgi:DNA-binding transcriptional LysR family regulator